MNKKEFDVLVYIERFPNVNSINKEIADFYRINLEEVNILINKLIERKFIIKNFEDTYSLTEFGYNYLDSYKVKRAIFYAAGFGSRLLPVTADTPKPLIKVHGTRIIDRLIDAVLEAGIDDIYIVRGYLKSNFDELLVKYPMIKFIDNNLYNQANNISSAILTTDILENSLILESDLILYDKRIIRKYEYFTNYRAIYKDATDDWCLETEGDLITEVKIGGSNLFEMVGISYWDKNDGKKLAIDIEELYKTPGGKYLFWDEVALVHKKEKYKVHIHEIKSGSVVEIDTFDELCEIDMSYKGY